MTSNNQSYKGEYNLSKFFIIFKPIQGLLPEIVTHVIKPYLQPENPTDYEVGYYGLLYLLEDIHDNLTEDSKNFTRCLEGACYGGQLETARWLVHNRENINPNGTFGKFRLNLNGGLSYACHGGHLALVELMVEKGATNLEIFLETAYIKGFLDIVKYLTDVCLQRGLYNGVAKIHPKYADGFWDICLTYACKGGHEQTLSYIIKKGKSMKHNFKWTIGLTGACVGGHLNIVHDMVERCAKTRSKINWNGCLQCAVNNGHVHIAKLALEKGVSSFRNWCHDLYISCKECHHDFVNFIREECKELNYELSYNSGLCGVTSGIGWNSALLEDRLRLAKLMIENGAHGDSGLTGLCCKYGPDRIHTSFTLDDKQQLLECIELIKLLSKIEGPQAPLDCKNCHRPWQDHLIAVQNGLAQLS